MDSNDWLPRPYREKVPIILVPHSILQLGELFS